MPVLMATELALPGEAVAAAAEPTTIGIVRWAIDLGFLATLVAVAVAAALTCIPGVGGSSAPGDTATLLLLLFVLAVAGVSLIAAGLCPTASAAAARTLLAAALPALAETAAFARRNVPILAVSAASSAATGILASAAQPVLCFVCFALFLLSISLATAGLASGTG